MDFNSIKLNDSQKRYVSPLCKLVNMAPRSNYLQATSNYGPGNIEGDDVQDDSESWG